MHNTQKPNHSSTEQVGLHDAVINHAREFAIGSLRKLGFDEIKISRFVNGCKKPNDNRWKASLPSPGKQRAAIIAARTIFEDTNAWNKAWKEQRWGFAVKTAYSVGRTVQLLQMCGFSTAEKQKANKARSARSSLRNDAANTEADRIIAQQLADNKPKLSHRQLHARITSKGYKISIKNFYRIRKPWIAKKDSPVHAQGN